MKFNELQGVKRRISKANARIADLVEDSRRSIIAPAFLRLLQSLEKHLPGLTGFESNVMGVAILHCTDTFTIEVDDPSAHPDDRVDEIELTEIWSLLQEQAMAETSPYSNCRVCIEPMFNRWHHAAVVREQPWFAALQELSELSDFVNVESDDIGPHHQQHITYEKVGEIWELK